MTLNTWFLDGMVAGGGGIIGVLDMDFKFKDEVNATNSVSFSCKSLFVDFTRVMKNHTYFVLHPLLVNASDTKSFVKLHKKVGHKSFKKSLPKSKKDELDKLFEKYDEPCVVDGKPGFVALIFQVSSTSDGKSNLLLADYSVFRKWHTVEPKKTDEESNKSSDDENDIGAGSGDMGTYIGIAAGIAALIIGIVVFVIWMMKRKKKKNQGSNEEAKLELMRAKTKKPSDNPASKASSVSVALE